MTRNTLISITLVAVVLVGAIVLSVIYKLRNPLYSPPDKERIWAPTAHHYGAHMVVRVKCDNGLEGFGERYQGKVTSAIATLIKDVLEPILIGQDPTNIANLYEQMIRSGCGRTGLGISAISAVEMALWDIFGKHCNVPLYKLLGGSVRNAMTPFASLKVLNTQSGFEASFEVSITSSLKIS